MVTRYPDSAKITYAEQLGVDEEGNVDFDIMELEVQGRFEPMADSRAKDTNYAGKFYCRRLNLERFKLDGTRLMLEDEREFLVTNYYKYQSYVELWLQ